MKHDHNPLDLNLGATLISSAFEQLAMQQNRLAKIFEPASVIMEQQSKIMKAIEPLSAITGVIEEHNRTKSLLSSSLLETISTQQHLFESPLLNLSSAIMTSFKMPELSSLTGSVAKLASLALEENKYNLAATMGCALETYIPKNNEIINNLSSALLSSMPKFNAIGELALRLSDSIPKIDYSVMSIANQSMVAMQGITESMQRTISLLGEAVSKIDFSPLIDFSHDLTYITDFEEKNETLKSFGWFLIPELPEEIVDQIYERRDEIAQDEVDTLIVQYFRNNKCQALKCIVKSWTGLPYFELRKPVFHEAQVSHSRRSFIASTTLISLHFEGVVTDFVRNRMNTPTYRVEKALKCINDMANDLTLDAMSFKDWIVCSYALECIDQAFTTNFSPADPDSCPDNSRHKIAHGHAVTKETEANSLRRFLFMNELYKLFRCLENEYELAS